LSNFSGKIDVSISMEPDPMNLRLELSKLDFTPTKDALEKQIENLPDLLRQELLRITKFSEFAE